MATLNGVRVGQQNGEDDGNMWDEAQLVDRTGECGTIPGVCDYLGGKVSPKTNCCRPGCTHTHDCIHAHNTEYCHVVEPRTFGQRLRVLRQMHNLRTHELASLLGVTRQYISVLEMSKGSRLPSRKLLRKMGILFDVSTSQLLGEMPLVIDVA